MLDLASLMASFRSGDSAAGARLVELFYPELKRMAASQMRGERIEHSWQPTLLVNELFLEILKIKALSPRESEAENDKAAFLALAGRVMRRLLIHHARLLASKAQKVPLFDHDTIAANMADTGDIGDILEIEQMLARLAAVKPELRTVVEMKVFEGLTADEIAERLNCAPVTINRYWQFARRWLQKEEYLTGGASGGDSLATAQSLVDLAPTPR